LALSGTTKGHSNGPSLHISVREILFFDSSQKDKNNNDVLETFDLVIPQLLISLKRARWNSSSVFLSIPITDMTEKAT
jgi:hypothetical protein